MVFSISAVDRKAVADLLAWISIIACNQITQNGEKILQTDAVSINIYDYFYILNAVQ